LLLINSGHSFKCGIGNDSLLIGKETFHIETINQGEVIL